MNEYQIITKATFNPKVKAYIFLVVAFFLLITVAGIVLLPFWLLGLGQWLSNKYFHTLQCELSTRNLRFSKGLLVHIEKTIPLENIQDLSFIGGPILRSFSLVIIRVETAGGGAHHQNSMSILGINDAEEMKKAILEQRELIIRERSEGKHTSTTISSDTILTEIKEELIKIRQGLEKK